MPTDSRSSSALFRRAEQLKRWKESETNQVPLDIPPSKKSKIKFSDGCVFLAACSAGDTEEVQRLLDQGADINFANVDGLTALHQACIDDNLEMVQFLVEDDCNVNQGDNEGWTPLHATASCGCVSIAKYLIEHGANVAAVNNDGDLPIDITENSKIEELLSDALDEQGIDCDEARSEEERVMLEDANKWLNNQKYEDQLHPRTGASALHVAAAKGYINVMNVLIQAGADLNAQDNDGWTPLHAAAHWGQKEACAILADNLANMDIQNLAGQTCFDVAETDLVRLLEELKRKQTSMQQERPEIQAILQRTSTRLPLKRRTSVTRMSGQEKSKSVMKDTKSERAQIEQLSLPEEDVEEEKVHKNQASGDAAEKQEKKAMVPERIPSWKKMLRRSSDNLTDEGKLPVESEVFMKVPKSMDAEDTLKIEESNGPSQEIGSSERNKLPLCDPSNHSMEAAGGDNAGAQSIPSPAYDSPTDSQTQIKRPFIPPVRDEESELQRKAHAKRVRETRRSTQGVLLEDVKTAELQYIIKKTQADKLSTDDTGNSVTGKSDQPIKELSQQVQPLELVQKEHEEVSTNKASGSSDHIVQSSDTNKSSEASSPDTSPSVTLALRTKTTNNSDEQSSPDSRGALGTQAAIQRRRRPKRRSTGVVYLDSDDTMETNDANDKDKVQSAKKNKTSEHKDEATASEKGRHKYGSSYTDVSSETSLRSETPSRYSSLSSSKSSINDEKDKDYKKLYEMMKLENETLKDLSKENEQLKETLRKTEEELESCRKQLKKVLESNSNKNTVSEAEKKERRALERKLSEMEEEVKNLSKLKTENEKLKAENRALSRVVCKLSK